LDHKPRKKGGKMPPIPTIEITLPDGSSRRIVNVSDFNSIYSKKGYVPAVKPRGTATEPAPEPEPEPEPEPATGGGGGKGAGGSLSSAEDAPGSTRGPIDPLKIPSDGDSGISAPGADNS
jgi:hypothetical protein